ncbi:transcription/translation regulatory transformer protein RfaH [Stutzerimonas nitrititolerans]|uniref:Transcription antitermination protein RfaH n=1 Tax=Stutzerimonas nitrititolerans TaxID=2482751 RepID=A0ABX9V4D0_9GAMM|nr:transcription/translation regulatory transformer protein RfaH [Stutzerimonas nitrititolerans]NNT92267.1 transcription/translation regulatory transformer protein RfaH [Stutzerimonas nitrititolerans]RMI00168.1 transcription/translation regulatory transformer protein RfaH [Stutzerimonas nitrititolerans]
MAAPISSPRWYLIQTKPRQEARAEENLRRQHFECYRPQKHGKTEEPLFPGYLFIRLDRQLDNWYPIRSTRGVARVISFGGEPTPVRDELIEQLRERLAAPAEKPRFQPGERVQLHGGSFRELEAIFVSADGEERSVILLNLLQREQKVRVPTQFLSLCAQPELVMGCRIE